MDEQNLLELIGSSVRTVFSCIKFLHDTLLRIGYQHSAVLAIFCGHVTGRMTKGMHCFTFHVS